MYHQCDGTHAIYHGGPDARHTSLSQNMARRQYDTRNHEKKLLEVLEYFFKKCLQHGLFLHAAKCNLYGTEVRYCGRFITAEVVRYDPRKFSTLQQMGTPQNGGDLAEYVAALKWMRSSLPLFAEKAAPLQDLLEVVYKEAK
jgi:hypothetical protein